MKFNMIAISIAIIAASCTSDNDDIQSSGLAVDSAENLAISSSVDTGRIEVRQVSRIVECSGEIEVPPTDIYAVHSMGKGFIRDLNYITGDRVRRGAVLARVENPEFIQMQRVLLEAKYHLELADKQYQRQTNLKKGEATTSKALEQATTELELSRAAYTGIKNELEAMGFDLQAIEERKEFQNILNVYSRATGVVQSVSVNIGELVSLEDEIMRIFSNEHVHIALRVLSGDAGAIEVGQNVECVQPGTSDTIHAKIYKISPHIDPQTKAVIVHCHFTDPSERGTAKPGTYLIGHIQVNEETVFGLNKSAVIVEGNQHFAYVVVGQKPQKVLLDGVREFEGFVAFDVPPKYAESRWITAGAYRID